MKKKLLALATASVLSINPAMAADLDVTVTNLTNGIYFTPLLIAVHDDATHLYQEGMAASSELQAMAEGGDISGLSTLMMSASANVVENPAAGMLAPGVSTTVNIMSDNNNDYLSIVGMLLPTNDGFVGADSVMIPQKKGSYTYYLNGYDAGTEANDEIINGGGMPGVAGVPKDPGGFGGGGATGVAMADSNMTVHIHRGNIGDMDSTAGVSDLDSSVHRWLNPIAKLVITVK